MISIALACRIDCPPYEVARPSRRPLSYDTSRRITSRSGVIDIDISDDALDPAAQLLLPLLSERGVQLWGQTAGHQRGELFVPVYRLNHDPAVARWINQIVANWRSGSRRIPPLVSLTVRWDGLLRREHLEIAL